MQPSSPDQEWIIGDYAVDPTPIESGAFGTVYRARHRRDGRPAALKLVLATDAPDSDDKLAAERRGAELQQQFGRVHGMVPEVYDFGVHRDRHFYIAMEYVEGGSLAQLIARGPLDPRAAAGHAIRICDFLEKAHQFLTIEGAPGSAIVHADLKPQHILLPTPGEIRVLDFGIAKALARTRQVTTNIWGTIYYASPEQLESGGVNPHVDFWSLGVMLYEMIAGHRPYAPLEHNRSRLEGAIRANDRREPLPHSCPPALAAIVNKLLAYQPERRYPDSAAIRADLQAFLDGGEPAAAREFHPAPTAVVAPRVLPPAAQSPADLVPPTDPLPLSPLQQAAPAGEPGRPARSAPGLRGVVRRLAWLGILLFFLGTFAAEAVAWMAAGRFRDAVDAIDGRTMADRKQDYDRIRAWGTLDVGLRWRVNRRLRDRLVAIGDAVITDYRREQPAVGLVEWRQAREALLWARQLAPGDRRLEAKGIECDGHITRILAQSQPRGSARRRQLFQAAIAKFRRAAELDPESFDPYLGISRTQVYGLDDVDGAVAAIAEAEKRGYQTSRRERAQLGDGFLRRGERSRQLARALSGEQRRRELQNAVSSYTRCVELFDPVVGFGNAARNLEFCKRQMKAVSQVLDADAAGHP